MTTGDIETCQTQNDITGVLSGVPTKAHHTLADNMVGGDDDMAGLEIKIKDQKHWIDSSTGAGIELAQGDMLQLRQLLKENKKMLTAGGDIAGVGLKETKDDMVINSTVVDLTSKAPADPVSN